MKRLLLLALLAGPAVAGDLTATWTHPTTNTDGSTIPATGPLSIASTRVEYFQCANASSAWPASPTVVSVPAPAATRTVTGLNDGQRYCFRAASVNVAGTVSAYSATASAVVPTTTPNPPVLTVTSTVAYRMRLSVDGYQMLAIGTVPMGTVCSDQTVGEYNVIPRSAVTMSSRFDTMPLTVYGLCG